MNELSSINANSLNLTNSNNHNATQSDKIQKSDFDELVSSVDSVTLSEKEKELFFSIVEDRFISTEEAESLSYEELQKIKEYILEFDENDKPFDASLVNASEKANALMASSMISDDEDFNKTVFEKIKNMEDEKGISSFMRALTGSSNIEGLVAFDGIVTDKFLGFEKIEAEDKKKFLEDKINEYQNDMQNEDMPPEYKELLTQMSSWLEELLEEYDSSGDENKKKLQNIMTNNRYNPLESLEKQNV